MKAVCLIAAIVLLALGGNASWAASFGGSQEVHKLRAAIKDLVERFGERYADGQRFLDRLDRIESRRELGEQGAETDFKALRREAILANPLLDCPVLLVKRSAKNRVKDIAIPAPHESNSGLRRTGYDNAIAILDLAAVDASETRGKLRTLFQPDDGGYVGEIDLH